LPLEQLPAFEPLPAALQKLLEPVADAPAHDTTGVPMQVWRRKTDGAHVVRVPAGRIPVGDATGYGRDNERPLRWLWLPEFFIDDCEISNAQFATFLNASAPTGDERIAWIGLRDPRSQLGFDGTRYAPLPGCENLPVVLVSHAGACAYSLWAWGRDPRDAMIDCCLPTAAQWERAAAFDPLHGCKREFPWGDSPPRELLPDGGESRARAHQVNAGRRIGEAEPTAWQELPLAPVRGENDDDAFAAGRTPAGLWHMAGNVREWLVTPIGEHPCPDELLPTQPDFTAATWLRLPASAFGGDLSVAYREVRGGSWHSGHASELRVTCRDLSRADQMHDDVGFRCAMPSGLGPALDPGLQSASMAGPETAAAGEEFVPARLRDIGDKAKGSAGEFAIYRRPRDSADMILIPAGTAKMGGGASRDANPVHDVTLGAFLIDRAEVSAAAFVMFLNAVKSRTVPDGWPDAGEVMILNEAIVGDGNFMMRADPLQLQGPITGVTWYGAQAYARWVGAVLPTEAQWERAARGTGDGPYPWGSAAPTDGVHAIFARNRPAIALGQVNDAARAAGESPYGVRDMAGNVWEWCADCYDPLVYADASRSGRDPLIGWPPGLRVNRGGGFRSPADALAVWTRAADPPGVSYDCLGFRCALPATLVPELASDDESRESEPR
ncbi:MAG: formylglycine-generating enzyme family protein, partial [Planctomycetota bacterium]